jgi:hypothetical protein
MRRAFQPASNAGAFAQRGVRRDAFPDNYSQAISQAQAATKAALADGQELIEIEFPAAGLSSVSGIHFQAPQSQNVQLNSEGPTPESPRSCKNPGDDGATKECGR